MIRRICKKIVFKVLYPLWYGCCSKKKVQEKKCIFVENHLDYLSENFLLLNEKLHKEGYDIHVHYLRIYEGNWLLIIKRSLKLLKDMGDASAVFLTESNSLFGTVSLRRETQLVQLWHACGAFKKWGRSVADKSFGEDDATIDQYNGHRNYTLVPVSGKAVCWAYEEAFDLQGKQVVKPLGVSRTDVFFDKEQECLARKALEQCIPWKEGRKVLLYAPTFRGSIDHARTPNQMDYHRLYETFHEDYIVLVKNHPYVSEEMVIPKELSHFMYEVKEEMPLSQLMFVADVCITDYSSLIFEYALLKRPMVFFAYDLDAYYDERGFYYPYKEFVPGPVVTDMDALVETIEHIDEVALSQIEAFCDAYMSGCDGQATKRIMDAVFHGR